MAALMVLKSMRRGEEPFSFSININVAGKSLDKLHLKGSLPLYVNLLKIPFHAFLSHLDFSIVEIHEYTRRTIKNVKK